MMIGRQQVGWTQSSQRWACHWETWRARQKEHSGSILSVWILDVKGRRHIVQHSSVIKLSDECTEQTSLFIRSQCTLFQYISNDIKPWHAPLHSSLQPAVVYVFLCPNSSLLFLLSPTSILKYSLYSFCQFHLSCDINLRPLRSSLALFQRALLNHVLCSTCDHSWPDVIDLKKKKTLRNDILNT